MKRVREIVISNVEIEDKFSWWFNTNDSQLYHFTLGKWSTLFGNASSTQDGLMTKEDKEVLDSLSIGSSVVTVPTYADLVGYPSKSETVLYVVKATNKIYRFSNNTPIEINTFYFNSIEGVKNLQGVGVYSVIVENETYILYVSQIGSQLIYTLHSPKKYIECSYNTINSKWSGWVTTNYDAIGAILDNKVDKVTGKGLSANDYTTTEKNKLAGIAAGAEVNVNADWNAITGDAQILNKPTSMPASDVYAWAKASSKPSYSWSEITSKPSTFTPSSHTHTKSQITDFPSSMPASDVYAWAKAATKPTYNASEVGAADLSHDHTSITGNAATATKLQTARTINGVSFDGSANITINAVDSTARIAQSEKGAINGVATLDSTGKVPSSQLPSYVDDVLEYSNFASFPVSGESGKIYIATDTNRSYRWSGSAYILIVTGNVDSVNGKTGVVLLAKADIGLGNVVNVDTSNPANIAWSASYRTVTDTEKTTWNGKQNALGYTAENSANKKTAWQATPDNTSYPSEKLVKDSLDLKVDKVTGKQLSTEDYTTAEKTKLSGIAEGANNYVHPTGDGNSHIPATSTTNNGKVLKAGATANSASWGNVDWSEIANKPTSMPASDVYAWAKSSTKPTYNASEIGGLGVSYRWLTDAYIATWNAKEPAITKLTAFNKDFGTTAGTVAEGNHTHTFASLTSKPSTLSGYGIEDVPLDNKIYGRKDGDWEEINSSGGSYASERVNSTGGIINLKLATKTIISNTLTNSNSFTIKLPSPRLNFVNESILTIKIGSTVPNITLPTITGWYTDVVTLAPRTTRTIVFEQITFDGINYEVWASCDKQ